MHYSLLLLLIACYVLLPTTTYGDLATEAEAEKRIEEMLTKNELEDAKVVKKMLDWLVNKKALLIELDEAVNSAAFG